jgi:hypothetical protein
MATESKTVGWLPSAQGYNSEMAPLQRMRFSVAERDRRWTGLRALMRREGLDAIVCPPNTGNNNDWQADARYITSIIGGNYGVILPLEGDVTVTALAPYRQGPQMQEWITEFREAKNWAHGRPLAQRLLELSLGRGNIGITGLGPGTRSGDGTILHGTYAAIREALPDATLVDATQVVQEMREAKSAEEIEVLRMSVELIEHAVDAIERFAQPGVPDHVVWAEHMHAMFVRGGELTTRTAWYASKAPLDTQPQPTLRPLEKGDVVYTEIEAAVLGYRSQQNVYVAVHECDPLIVELSRIHSEEFYPRLCEVLRAGSTSRELVETAVALGPKLTPRTGPLAAGLLGAVTLHGRGLGDDRPLLLTRAGGVPVGAETLRDWELPFPSDGVYILKPTLFMSDRRRLFRWGDSVRTTPKGAVRLGKHPAGLVVSRSQKVEWAPLPMAPGYVRA